MLVNTGFLAVSDKKSPKSVSVSVRVSEITPDPDTSRQTPLSS
jgi:hypothetical protein